MLDGAGFIISASATKQGAERIIREYGSPFARLLRVRYNPWPYDGDAIIEEKNVEVGG